MNAYIQNRQPTKHPSQKQQGISRQEESKEYPVFGKYHRQQQEEPTPADNQFWTQQLQDGLDKFNHGDVVIRSC